MTRVTIDLDHEDPPPPPPRRWPVALFLVAGLLAVGAVFLTRPAEEPVEPPGPLDVPALWAATVPDGSGRALAARVVGESVLVVGEHGVVAYGRKGGGEVWRRSLSGDVTSASAWQHVRVADGVVVVDDPAGYVVVDVATGSVRFTIRPDGEAAGAVVLPDRVVVFGCDGGDCTATATGLDGTALWRAERDATPLLPEPVSSRHQTVAVANPAPIVPEPGGGLFLWRDGGERTAVDLATGTELGTWAASEGADLRVYGGHVVDVGLSHTLRCLNPATGETLWTRATLSEPGESGPVTLVDGHFLDSADSANHDSPGYYQLIDPATGDIPSTPTAAGRRILAVHTGLAVGLDPVTAELTAVRPRDSVYWRATLRTEGPETFGFVTTGFLTGDGWLAVGDVRGGLWYIELATGAVGNTPGGEVIGLDDGALISADSTRHRVELRELGLR
ncbi:outer membrane protein assembly factor BamB family protein [Phytomonospora endophytica]|uniref:Outer membrane protein assembly factor BamB n=1 Tax=Phytomonospora endophytica TaxID=714109 RepID=A0A841G7B2_9ACTN|nr:PQQ-binding-like beta-propeller repeat protein [Phytomonospora endophytica]MBB6039960.1 outer membrane protein assembly factor BamB [Phytomonospora endophytica]GIG70969.1 hypothetical protein Pen01_72640 [Phytomonospora endophytica]